MQTQIFPAGQAMGVAGQLADSGNADVLSAFNEEASAAIAFGLAVKQGTTDRGVKLLASVNDTVKGLTVFSYNHVSGTGGDLDASGATKPTGMIDLLVDGRALVIVEEAVSAGDRAFVRAVADAPNSLNVIGSFRKSQDVIAGPVNSCIDITRNAIFRTSAAAGGLAVVEVDFTIKAG